MIILPEIYLLRHGETLWTLSGQHTGITDLPLTPKGEKEAMLVGPRLREIEFDSVFVSPRKRAQQTYELTKIALQPTLEPLLQEWNYGDYEGLTTSEIKKKEPDWFIFNDGCPHGESPKEIAHRCDLLIHKLKKFNNKILLVAHAHLFRMLATRWLGLSPECGRLYYLSTASLSILGYEHHRNEPVIRLWNDTSHLTHLV